MRSHKRTNQLSCHIVGTGGARNKSRCVFPKPRWLARHYDNTRYVQWDLQHMLTDKNNSHSGRAGLAQTNQPSHFETLITQTGPNVEQGSVYVHILFLETMTVDSM